MEFVHGFQAHFCYGNLVMVDQIGTRGALALFYNNEFQVKILFSSNQMIDVEAITLEKHVFMTFIYGEPVQNLRDHV